VPVLCLREAEVRKIAEQVTAEGYPAWLANVNSADQMVLTGTAAALERGRELARAGGARRAGRLDVAVPSHAPILEPVSAELRSLLAGCPARPLAARYVTISTARPATTSTEILDDLAHDEASYGATMRTQLIAGLSARPGQCHLARTADRNDA